MPQTAAHSQRDTTFASPPRDDRRDGSADAFPARSGLLGRLVRLTRTANEDRAEAEEDTFAARRAPPNRCEFDYDYYVALQSRRRAQPSRPNHRNAPG